MPLSFISPALRCCVSHLPTWMDRSVAVGAGNAFIIDADGYICSHFRVTIEDVVNTTMRSLHMSFLSRLKIA